MSDLYSHVHPGKQQKRQKDIGIVIACAAAVAAVALVFGIFLWYTNGQNRYRQYISDLSDSTTFAYSNGVLTVTDGGDTYVVDDDNIYKFYQLVTTAGRDRVLRSTPSSEPDMLLDFGDGSSACVWDITVRTFSGTKASSCICYVNPDGRRYIYRSSTFELRRLRVFYYNFASSDGDSQ